MIPRRFLVVLFALSLALLSASAAGDPLRMASPEREGRDRTGRAAPASGSAPGLPPLHSFAASDYGATPQNWSVVQDRRGVVYVGNVDSGILEFDGARWRRIPLPNHSTVRGLALGADGRVYVGAQSELGYLAPDPEGTLRYVSLVPRLPAGKREFADVWQVIPTAEGVYFHTSRRLFRYGPDGMRSWDLGTSWSFEVGGRLVLRDADRGLLEMAGDRLRPLPGGERFAKERICAIVPWGRGPSGRERWLIATRDNGFLLWDGASARPWPTDADAHLKASLMYGARRLPDGSLAVATLQGGLSVIDADGRERLRLTKQQGLTDDGVLGTHLDDQQGLWLALGSGLARLQTGSPLSFFDSHTGLGGIVLALGRQAGSLYVGTTHGVFRQTATRPVPRFEPVTAVPGTTWAMLELPDSLLVAHLTGVHEIRDGKAHEIVKGQVAHTALLRSRTHPERVFVGNGVELLSLRREHGRWIAEGRVTEMPEGVYTLAEDAAGRLWVGTDAEAAARVSFVPGSGNGGPPAVARVERFGAGHGLDQGAVQAYAVGNEVLFAGQRGVLRYDDARGRFVPHEALAGLFPDGPRRISALVPSHDGRELWMDTRDDARGVKESGAAVRQPDGRYRWDPRPLAALRGRTAAPMAADPDGVIWLGDEQGLYRFDARSAPPRESPFDVLIRRVSTREGEVLYGGSGAAAAPRLPFDRNGLRFEFAAPRFGAGATQYQARLDGMDADWSDWSTETHRDYTNLPEGSYRFRVRARDLHGAISREGLYTLDILPPWYRTWWAYLAYALAASAALVGLPRYRSRVLERRNAQLSALVTQRTRELHEANRALREQSHTDPLTGLRNRRYVTEHIARDVALSDRAYEGGDGAPRNADTVFLLIDIDHFKEINDRYGHAAGDRVLQQFRDVLQDVGRRTDTVVRWGGEEFLVIAHGVDRDAGALFAERIRAAVAAHPFEIGHGVELRRTCSIGFAPYPVFASQPRRLGWEQVADLADQCLYVAKRGGRDAWVGVAGQPAPPSGLDEALERPDTLVATGALRLLRGPAADDIQCAAPCPTTGP